MDSPALGTAAPWDLVSASFARRPVPTADDDMLMRLVTEYGLVSSDSRVLDVGCGAGQHLVALAPLIRAGTGVDVSPAMIDEARALARRVGVIHVAFEVLDWRAADAGWDTLGEFDLVIAHNTPAIHKVEDLHRLLDRASGACVVSKPVYRRSDLVDLVLRGTGREQQTEAGSRMVGVLLGELLQQGYAPDVRYMDQVWSRWIDREDFVAGRWISAPSDLPDRLAAVAAAEPGDGPLGDRTDARVAYLYWDMRRRRPEGTSPQPNRTDDPSAVRTR